MGTINSDEHDAKHGVRSGEEQPLALEHRDKPGGVILLTIHREKSKGESVSEAEWRRVPANRSAAETNSLDRSSWTTEQRPEGEAHAARGGALVSVAPPVCIM